MLLWKEACSVSVDLLWNPFLPSKVSLFCLGSVVGENSNFNSAKEERIPSRQLLSPLWPGRGDSGSSLWPGRGDSKSPLFAVS